MSIDEKIKLISSAIELTSTTEVNDISNQGQSPTSNQTQKVSTILKSQIEKTKEPNSILRALGTPGPFQVIDGPILDKSTKSELDHPPEGPRRRYDCKNYETCLNLAAALNWDSFTCRGCCEEVNEKLLWRAQHEMRKDQMAKAICDLPNPRQRKIESPASPSEVKLVEEKN